MEYEAYSKMLFVNKHRLDDELEVQADIQERISTRVVTLNSRAIEAKDELAQTEARVGDSLRDAEKLSIAAIAAKVSRDPARIRAWQKYQAARDEHEKWAGLLEAWRNRGFSMKALGQLYAASYFAINSLQSEMRRRDDDEHERRRADMRKARNDGGREAPAETAAPPRRRAIE